MTNAIRQQISAFASAASLEILPSKKLDFLKDLEIGTRIYITDNSNAERDVNRDSTLACAQQLSEKGMIPVPHIAARRIESEAALKQLLNRMKNSGIQNIMLIAGSVKRKNPYASSIDLLNTNLFEDFNISVAGHPDANWMTTPSAKQSLSALEIKARKVNNLRIITQLSFNPDTIETWAEKLPINSQTAQIYVGLSGPASRDEKFAYAGKCKLDYTNLLLTQGTRLYNIFTKEEPDEMIAQLAALKQKPNLIGGIHFFTFDNPAKTAQFIKALREGNFTLNETQTGFHLNAA